MLNLMFICERYDFVSMPPFYLHHVSKFNISMFVNMTNTALLYLNNDNLGEIVSKIMLAIFRDATDFSDT